MQLHILVIIDFYCMGEKIRYFSKYLLLGYTDFKQYEGEYMAEFSFSSKRNIK